MQALNDVYYKNEFNVIVYLSHVHNSYIVGNVDARDFGANSRPISRARLRLIANTM